MRLTQALEDNADLMSRLIDVALTSSHDDKFIVSSEGRNLAQADKLTQVPLGQWSQEEAQRRHEEVKDEVSTTGCF